MCSCAGCVRNNEMINHDMTPKTLQRIKQLHMLTEIIARLKLLQPLTLQPNRWRSIFFRIWSHDSSQCRCWKKQIKARWKLFPHRSGIFTWGHQFQKLVEAEVYLQNQRFWWWPGESGCKLPKRPNNHQACESETGVRKSCSILLLPHRL